MPPSFSGRGKSMNENNFEDILSSVMSDGNLMNKISGIVKSNKSGDVASSLPDVIAALSPILNGDKRENTGSTEKSGLEKDKREDSENIESATAEVLKKDSGNILSMLAGGGRSSKLLLALKPYVSRERRDMIDTIVRVSQIADIIKTVR